MSRRRRVRASTDDGSSYYNCWLAALETILVEKGIAESEALALREAEWIRAHEATPHGRLVNYSRTPLP